MHYKCTDINILFHSHIILASLQQRFSLFHIAEKSLTNILVNIGLLQIFFWCQYICQNCLASCQMIRTIFLVIIIVCFWGFFCLTDNKINEFKMFYNQSFTIMGQVQWYKSILLRLSLAGWMEQVTFMAGRVTAGFLTCPGCLTVKRAQSLLLFGLKDSS